MPKGQLSEEALNVDPSKYKSYDELPLVHTGCDSYPAWDVRFKKFSPMMTIPQIVDKIQALLPNGKFSGAHLILTGGEPLLGWQRAYPALLDEIDKRDMDLSHLTFETNGTQPIQDVLRTALNDFSGFFETTFSISSKLTNSGEKWEEAIRPDVVWGYIQNVHNCQAYFKWVCSSPDDIVDVDRAVAAYAAEGIRIPVYLMCAGGTEKHYFPNKDWLAKLCLERGYRFSPRLQIDLFGNQWAT